MDDVTTRIETALETALRTATGAGDCPPQLAAAVRHAVFPGGGRVRPRLCLAVAAACGDDAPAISTAAAVSLELLHCASLVHDDLPCFDNAATRRGQPSVHYAFGERLAVLVGDGLITLAFEQLAHHTQSHPERLVALTKIVGRSVGISHGIVAGQAWECEPRVELTDYHRQKTAALFAAATEAGAAAAGQPSQLWYTLGEQLGLAYQVADDIRDVASTPEAIGKPIGQDVAHQRPSATTDLGLDGAMARLKTLVETASASIPHCPGADRLRQLIQHEMRRLLPAELAQWVITE
ncbi:polyprenyl synthetase family protein [Rhodoferax sp. 4810]|uniref:Polyprenyl synthetase family protein n=1 Tax=Thiospirillum jenense TaxID=1653858 RepID=A0A839HI40_9GAMM|nr:polyprenyl synthetase family protein [Thiospirillum jenense]MBB1074790.1 polyprenyl synthetase family protein [Rhodoferax jenense]MBB1126628.1 polyprenyl synthetase family protein [Thiospirillum jenense]